MLLALACCRAIASQQIVSQSHRLMAAAQTIVVTTRALIEEFPGRELLIKYWSQKGGYVRAERKGSVDVGNPTRGWHCSEDTKTYSLMPGVEAKFSLESILIPPLDPKVMPTVGVPTDVTWHGRKLLRVEIDGTKAMTKETKMFLFYEPKTYLPAGVSANLGSATQVTIFEDLKLDTKLDPKLFDFTPPSDWKEVKASRS